MNTIDSFLADRGNAGYNKRFMIQSGQLVLVNKGRISPSECFKAKMGTGHVSMKKVAALVEKNRNTLLTTDSRDDFNAFLKEYNSKQKIIFSGK